MIRESDYFTERGEFRVDSEGSPTLLNCLMYKLSYYRFGELKFDYNTPAGFDRCSGNWIIRNHLVSDYLIHTLHCNFYLVSGQGTP